MFFKKSSFRDTYRNTHKWNEMISRVCFKIRNGVKWGVDKSMAMSR